MEIGSLVSALAMITLYFETFVSQLFLSIQLPLEGLRFTQGANFLKFIKLTYNGKNTLLISAPSL